MRHCAAQTDRPQIIIADTVKGRGVSFMEHTAIESDADYVPLPLRRADADSYSRAAQELLDRINGALGQASAQHELILETIEPPTRAARRATPQRLIPAYTEALLACAAEGSTASSRSTPT